MSYKLQIVLPDPVASQLHGLAQAAGLPLATLAGQMVSHEVAQVSESGKPTRPPRPLTISQGTSRAPWLEPYGGDRAWRAETWGAIVALYGRYPRHLKALKHGWWNDDWHTEMLAALAYGRQELDDNATDFREEVSFLTQLQEYARLLSQEPGGIGQAWTPGAPPPEWT